MSKAEPIRESAPELIGASPAMVQLALFIDRAAPTRSTVLIQGESGTGKELVARALHQNSRRRDGPFVVVNCAALPEGILESVLFGHEKGSFTGALCRHKGKFELAEGGTLFLDEVGELSPAIQAKALRALQERTIERLGGTESIPVDIRVIAATNRDLETAIAAGQFREDLYYRLAVLRVSTTPLRDRPEDIPALAEHYALKYGADAGRVVHGVSAEAVSILQNYDWPGNVRELQNTIEHAIALGSANVVLPEELPKDFREKARRSPESFVYGYHAVIRQFARTLLESALHHAGSDYKKAAGILGLHKNSMHKIIRQLNLTDLLPKMKNDEDPGKVSF